MGARFQPPEAQCGKVEGVDTVVTTSGVGLALQARSYMDGSLRYKSAKAFYPWAGYRRVYLSPNVS